MPFDLETWGEKSSPKESIPKIIENFRALREDGIAYPDSSQVDHTEIQNIGVNSHTQIDNHIANSDNPHNVTPAQIGADTPEGVQVKINQAIDSLINSAPDALNTLKELSDALGNDPNFVTTLTNLIATKETPVNAQGKANVAETNAKTYSNSQLNNHKTSNDHDDRYYTETEVNDKLALKADTSTVNSALALKADLITVDTALTLKSDKTEVEAWLAAKETLIGSQAKADIALNNARAYADDVSIINALIYGG